MNTPFEFTAQATEDLDAIWWFIAETTGTLPIGWKRKLSPVAAAWPDIR